MKESFEPAPTAFTRLALTACAALLAGFLATDASARCDPELEADAADIAAARAAVEAACDCSAASTHGAYVSCASQTAKESLVNPSCSKYVKKCAARSTCGKPGFVSCCITSDKGTKCKSRKSEQHCTDKGGVVSACASCCDACPAPGSGVSCAAPPTTTVPPPSTTVPPPSTTLPPE
jgi:hypothetical protein